jgi:glucosamine--fructose-6-phosphate aminotransferase (isomerizing)
MCGIIAVVRQRSDQPPLETATVTAAIDQMLALLADDADSGDCASQLGRLDRSLRGERGVECLVATPLLGDRVEQMTAKVWEYIARIEARIESGQIRAVDLEAVNRNLLVVRDAAWALERDRVRAARQTALLAGPNARNAAVAAMFSLHQALSALDRLEVRGRDSAGIEIVVSGHGLDLDDPGMLELIEARSTPLFVNNSVDVCAGHLIFVYKAAAEIGELGDNTAALRDAIYADELLRAALAADTAEALVLGHTRWASVGIISEANAHPQNSAEVDRDTPAVTAVLNGDVDNFADLISDDDLSIAPGITTDAKVIPAVMARRLAAGDDAPMAFRETVASIEGSVAIAANAAEQPDRLYLALRGSGQALYVGFADGAYIVASEPYGVVEETDRYLRMDGETPSNPDSPSSSRGQIVELRRDCAGSIAGLSRWSYDGTELEVGEDELVTAEITTRDIDRGDYPHFLLKEISDAPSSFSKTLRGKLVEDESGMMAVSLGESTLPTDIRAALEDRSINRVQVIGQGTAAVAGQSLALALSRVVADTEMRVEALPATELSGFGLRESMADTLIIAISQSGTTTDTNRTVDLARGRGARVISIVNRRGSDLCDKSDGVLFTSDGRDVEMSVASTKAFYSQIAAGMLLANKIADLVPEAVRSTSADSQQLFRELRDLPDKLIETLSRRASIGEVARQFAPSRRYWAIVGNGSNQIAARELRIKLSELCYKSIACDATEDKKHIDLSAEPMIIVCATGLIGSTADDVGKEVAIYRAHKAAPLVIATDGAHAFDAALSVMWVPETDPRLAFVLSAMVGHLFGYEAALAIDAQAQPLREARAVIELLAGTDDGASGDQMLRAARVDIEGPSQAFGDGIRNGELNGHLEAGTAVRLSSLFRYATGVTPLDLYQTEFGKVGTPGLVLDGLTSGLTSAIEELTRPIDAIKHQAKTVTVGISRSDEGVLQVPLVAAALEAGAPRDRLSYATLRSIADLDAAVEEVVGFTRYSVDGDDISEASIIVVDRGGIAANLRSRAERDPRLRGTKHLVARERELMVARGRSDGRTVLIIPETKDGGTTGLTLLHLSLRDRLPAATARGVLQGYRHRFQALRDAITETEDTFREDLLAEQPVIELLCEPILDLADRWRTAT